MLRKKLLCVALSVCSLCNVFVMAEEENNNSITAENFNTFSVGTFPNSPMWTKATENNLHTIEVVSVGENDNAAKITVSEEGGVASLSRSRLSINNSFIASQDLIFSDLTEKTVFAMADSTNTVYTPVYCEDGKVSAMDGVTKKNVGTYSVDSKFNIEIRVSTDVNSSTNDFYDLYINGSAVATNYKFPANFDGNVKKIVMVESTGGSATVDNFNAEYFTPVVRTLQSIEFTSSVNNMSVGEEFQLALSGKLSDDSDANLAYATVSYSSDAPGIIAVSQSGRLQAKAEGTATITVTVTLDTVTLTKTLTVRAKIARQTYLMNENYQVYNNGAFKEQAPSKYLLGMEKAEYSLLVEDEDGNKVLRMCMESLDGNSTNFPTGKDTYIGLNNTSITDPIEISTKIKITNFANSARVIPFLFYDAAGGRIMTVLIRSGSLIMDTTSVYDGIAPNTWYDMKFVLYHDGDKNTTDTYDLYFNGRQIYKNATVTTNLGPITQIRVVSNTNYAPFSVYLDDTKISTVTFPVSEGIYVSGNKINENGTVNPDTSAINVKFSHEMTDEVLDAIELYSVETVVDPQEGEKKVYTKLDATVTLDQNGKDAYIAPSSAFIANKEYQIRVKDGITDAEDYKTYKKYEYNFKTGNYDYIINADFYNGNNKLVELNGETTVKADIKLINNKNTNLVGELVIAQYSADKKLITYSKEEVTVNANNSNSPLQVLKEQYAVDANAKYIGVYLWDKALTQKALCDGFIFGKDFATEEVKKVSSLKVTADDYNEQIKISGYSPNNKYVSVEVLNPSNTVCGIRQAVCDVNGNYLIEIPYEDNYAINETYTVKVYEDALTVKSITFNGKNYANTLMGNVNNTPKESLESFLNTNSAFF